MLLCGSAVRPADSFKAVASPLNERFMGLAGGDPLSGPFKNKTRLRKHNQQRKIERASTSVAPSPDNPGRLYCTPPTPHSSICTAISAVGCRSCARLHQGSTMDLALYSLRAPSFSFRHTVLRGSSSSASFTPRAMGSTPWNCFKRFVRIMNSATIARASGRARSSPSRRATPRSDRAFLIQ